MIPYPEIIFLLCTVPFFRQICFLFEKCFLQHRKFFRRTDLPAHRSERFRHPETVLQDRTWIFITGGAVCDMFFFTACSDTVSAPVVCLASGAGDFFLCDDMIAIADFKPQFSGLLQLFLGFFKWMLHISRTSQAVIAACRKYSLHVFRLPERSLVVCGYYTSAAKGRIMPGIPGIEKIPLPGSYKHELTAQQPFLPTL